MGDQISRFMDGELEGAEVDAALRELRRQEGVATWVCYHVIGDSLRRCGAPTPGFGARFAARLDAEPTVLAPKPKRSPQLPALWAAAATVAAVSLVGWIAVSTLGSQSTIVATLRAPRVVSAPLPQDYVLAHQESSPTTQIQGVGTSFRAVSAAGADGRP
jgi:sigma-E factor negative regulatory protein RseA